MSKFELSETQLVIGQSETKLLVKPNWSEKITVLTLFLESSLNFLSNPNLKSTTKFGTARKKSDVKV